jgi:hypothetical protein
LRSCYEKHHGVEITDEALHAAVQLSIRYLKRSKAASFSIYFWYSSRVVAPIVCNSPRAKAGFKIFEASIAPSAPPAPRHGCLGCWN